MFCFPSKCLLVRKENMKTKIVDSVSLSGMRRKEKFAFNEVSRKPLCLICNTVSPAIRGGYVTWKQDLVFFSDVVNHSQALNVSTREGQDCPNSI